MFSRAVLELTLALDWKPDIVHAHDWHTAPALTWLSTAGQGSEHFRGIASVFTIHNLAHQGKTNWRIFDYLGLQTHALAEEGYDEVNFMARGIYHATMINTVSPTYAQEIMTPAGGAGLDKLLRHRHFDVHGILNGLDYDEWNPVADGRLASHFDAEQYDDDERALFKTYHKRFKLGSKPAAHIDALAQLSDEELLNDMPESLARLADAVIAKLEELPE